MKTTILLMLSVLSAGCSVLQPVAGKAATLAERYEWMAQQSRFRDRFLSELPTLRVERLYYIDPMVNPGEGIGTIQGWAVLSQADVPGTLSSSNALQQSLSRIIASAPQYMAGCFDPHHAAVLSNGREQFDVVICFKCGNYRIHSPDGGRLLSGAFDVNEEPTWEHVFALTGLKREQAQ